MPSPGRIHQSLLWLLQRDHELVIELAAHAAGQPAPTEFTIGDHNPSLQRPRLTPSGIDYDGVVTLDLLLTVHDKPPNTRVRAVWIIEVQIHRSLTRIHAWYDSRGAAARNYDFTPVDVDFLVICPDPSLRSWIHRRIVPAIGIPPTIVEPRHVPWIDDLTQARARPEAAVLSAVFHGHELRAREVVHAAWHAVAHLEPQTRNRYRYLIQTAAHRDMQLPNPIQNPDPDDYPTQWEERGLTWAQHGERFAAEGRKEGLQQGLQQGLQRALLLMLERVGLELTPTQRTRVERCEDITQLETWMRRVLDATTPDAIFDPG